MKYINQIYFLLIACILSLSSCSDSDDVKIKGFDISLYEMTVGADGGSEKLSITSDSEWVATCDQPWVRLSQANGIGSTDCSVLIDSSLVEGIRTASIRISNDRGDVKKIAVNQTGYGKCIAFNSNEFNIESSAKSDKRFFEVFVTTNTLFTIDIESKYSNWISYDKNQLEIDLDRGARPRTFKLRFDWQMNVINEERIAKINFIPLEGTITDEAVLTVKQASAPVIEDNRAGDSLALLMIQEKIDAYTGFATAEVLNNWDGVTLWEKTDKDVTPEMIGRVRGVAFFIFNTTEELPVEISKLKFLERISFLGNTNTFLKSISLGEAFNDLKYLKKIMVCGYGLVDIPESFSKLSQLEEIDFSMNNINEFPTIINKNNFPNLKKLRLSGNRRQSYFSDLSTDKKENMGLYMDITKNISHKNTMYDLLSWENLEVLELSNNYIEGILPEMKDYPITYTAEDIAANDTLSAFLIGKPKILPNARRFTLNLNMLTGSLPEWLLYHPNLTLFDPFTLIYMQEGFNSDAKRAGFDNEPVNWEYYYEIFPLRKPTNN
ncbi:MAG: hypothetical protein RR346_03620 [Bacteroidales bacterium]